MSSSSSPSPAAKELDINETGAQLQGWQGKSVWIAVHAGSARPVLNGSGQLDIEQEMAREFGGDLRGDFAFSVGAFRLYVVPENFRGATGDTHELRIRLDSAEIRIRDEIWGLFHREKEP